VKAAWNQYLPGNTFDYFFLDEHFDAQYKADQRFGKVFGLFTGLAILVSCLGLFGLASFTTYNGQKRSASESVGRFRDFDTQIIVPRICDAAYGRFCNSYTHRVVHDAYMAQKLCVPDKYAMELFPVSFYAHRCSGAYHSKFQSVRAAMANPVKEFEDRISVFALSRNPFKAMLRKGFEIICVAGRLSGFFKHIVI
jgi:hypothetical protein